VNFLDGNHREEMVRDIRRGMMRIQKSIPSKYFYDGRGSLLFEQICMTPEYYPTKTELSILDRSGPEIIQFFSRKAGDLIELGSGSNQKIRKLLEVVRPLDIGRIRYVPVDISNSSLLESATELLQDYENLEILGVLADFTRHVGVLPRCRKLITFFGSTIGNLTEEEAILFLRSIRTIMNSDDRFLLGMDMLKPVEVLEAAYNDKRGVTRDFNRNILEHINRELQGDFNPEDFDHLAFFNAGRERVEMHLRARRTVKAHIADLGLSCDIGEGETIHTEICRKFSRESAGRLFQQAGLSIARWFTDSKGWFSLVELEAQ
jgi:L-histidine N-alpha-methyltransferase